MEGCELSYKKEIAQWVKSYDENPMALEIIAMWVENPSSLTVNFGGDVFWSDVKSNLLRRYPDDEIDETMDKIEEEIDEFFTPKRDAYNVIDAIAMAYYEHGFEPLWEFIDARIRQNRALGETLIEVCRYFDDEGLWDRTRGIEWFYSEIIDDVILKSSSSSFDDLISSGIFYKLTWVKVNSSSEERIFIPFTWVVEEIQELLEDVPKEKTEIPSKIAMSTVRRRLVGLLKMMPRVSVGELEQLLELGDIEVKTMVSELVADDIVRVTFDPHSNEFISLTAIEGKKGVMAKGGTLAICMFCGKRLDKALTIGEEVTCSHCGSVNIGK
jgi:hypothetical protein